VLEEKKRGPGRPRKNKPIRMYFAGYLHPGEDDDLIEWWYSLPKGKRFPILIAILRSGGGLDDVDQYDEDAGKAEEAIENILESFMVE